MSVPSPQAFQQLEQDLAASRAREAALSAEATAYQKALVEVLAAMVQFPGDPGRVFETLLERAIALSGAMYGFVSRFDGELVSNVATRGLTAEEEAAAKAFPMMQPHKPDLTTLIGRAVLEKRIVQVQDVDTYWTDSEWRQQVLSRGKSAIAFPLLRDGNCVGAFSVAFPHRGALPDRIVDMLQTFAAQAALVIDNAQRFNDTRQALEHQTALSDILRVISESPTDLQPVFDAIAARAAALCNADGATTSRFDGELIHIVSVVGGTREGEAAIRAAFPRAPSRDSLHGRVVTDRAIAHIEDSSLDESFSALARDAWRRANRRAMLAVPMMRGGEVLGVIGVGRGEPGYFSSSHVQLLQAFADQAVIAVENVRLFNETREALERQTAMAEILQVISRSPADVTPVFDAIAEHATTLCKADTGMTSRFDGELIHMVGIFGVNVAGADFVRAGFPRRPEASSLHGRAVMTRALVHVPDVFADDVAAPSWEAYRRAAIRAVLAVPMLREGEVVGVVSVIRSKPGLFPEPLVKLLQAFADQAVIAIENARLFTETQEALERQTATAEVLKVISSSVDDAQPVFEKILDSCQALFDVQEMMISRLHEDGQLHLSAQRGAAMEVVSKLLPRPLEGTATAQAIREHRTIHIPESSATNSAYTPFLDSITKLIGNHSGLVAPLLRDGRGIGSIWIVRVPVKPFSEREIALLTTFADQAVIAIENARLFRETQEALEHQTATAEILKVISSSPTSTQPVFQTIAERARAVSGWDFCNLVSFDGDLMHLGASAGFPEEELRWLREMTPFKPTRGSAAGRAILTGRFVNIADLTTDPEFEHQKLSSHYRSMVGVPLIRNSRAIGALTIGRRDPGGAPDKLVRLLQTFADQAVIAIENVSLFQSTQEALEQQTATSEVLQVISTSMADTQPVYRKILDSCELLIPADLFAVFELREGLVYAPEARGVGAARMQAVYPLPLEEPVY